MGIAHNAFMLSIIFLFILLELQKVKLYKFQKLHVNTQINQLILSSKYIN